LAEVLSTTHYKTVWNEDNTKFIFLYNSLIPYLKGEFGVNHECVFIYYGDGKDMLITSLEEQIKELNLGFPVYVV
jgi:hypothetical protein